MADMFSSVGMIMPMGSSDLKADDVTPKYAKGQISFVRDLLGVRIFRYMNNALAAAAATVAGGVYTKAADVSSTLGAGSTTTLLKKTAGFTAGAQVDWAVTIITNSVAAGTAPEGETGNIVANDANSLSLDASRPLSAAPNSGDTFFAFSLFDFINSAAGNLAADCMGVSVSPITNTNWGVIQTYGPCPDVKCNAAAAIAARVPVITGTALVTTGAAAASKLWVGYSLAAANATNRGFLPVFLHTFAPALPGAYT